MTRLALLQTTVPNNKSTAIAQMTQRIREAAAQGAQIMCLPELFASPYFCQEEDHRFFALSEAANGHTVTHMTSLAAELGVVIVVPFFERVMPGVYFNSTAVIDADGTNLGTYRKMHIPDDPGFYEKFYFAPGDLGYRVFETRFAKIGVLICWDQWYPEAARLTTLKGAELLIYPTAIGWHPQEKAQYGETQFNAWQRVQLGHAIANGVYVATVNRVGFEPRDQKDESCEAGANATAKGDQKGQALLKNTSLAGDKPCDGIEFWGRSFLSGPQGEILQQAGETEETLYHQIDFSHIETVRQHWPFLRDRRIETFGDITKRYL